MDVLDNAISYYLAFKNIQSVLVVGGVTLGAIVLLGALSTPTKPVDLSKGTYM
jgi:hypothetical protein